MYQYILNYDKNTNLKNPDYQAVYSWLEKQSGLKKFSESIYFFESNSMPEAIQNELGEIFYKSDDASIIYIVKNKDEKTVTLLHSEYAFFKTRKINGSKTKISKLI